MDKFRNSLGEILRELKHDKSYKYCTKHKLILAVEGQPTADAIATKAKDGRPRIEIWDENFFAYYSSLQRAIKNYAIFSLLADLGVEPDKDEQLSVPAFSIEAAGKSKNRLFIFSILAKDLMRYSYVARRGQGGETYYQRMIKVSRLGQIARYIDKGMIFPNSIVVALTNGTWSFLGSKPAPTTMPSWESFGTLTLNNNFNACWIIDGQHRLYAHAHTNTQGRLVVAAFADISESKQARYFLDINREAKKVDANLLWDLPSVLIWCETTSPQNLL